MASLILHNSNISSYTPIQPLSCSVPHPAFPPQAVYSSMYEVLGSFTRDFDQLKSRLASLAEYDKSCVETALLGVNAVVAEEWGSGTACQVRRWRL